MGRGVRVVPPPDHVDGDRRRVPQRPEDDAIAPVLGRGSLRSDPDAAACRDDREPVVDIPRVPDARSVSLRPEVGGRGPGAAVDQHGALRYLSEPDGAPSGPGIVRREGAEAPLMSDDGAGEVPGVGRGPQDRDVAQALGQAAGRRVGANQVEFDVRVPGRPAALELAGVPPHGRPGVTDTEPGMAGGRFGDEVFRCGQHLSGLGQDVHAGRGRGDGPAGAVQQSDAENPLQRHQVPRHRGLRDAELDSGVGEGS